jgi:hypothetical protein
MRVKRGGSETSLQGKPRRHRSPPRSLSPSTFLSPRRDGARSSCTWIAGTNRRGEIKNRRVFAASASASAPRRAEPSRAEKPRVLTWSDNPPYNFVATKRSTADDIRRRISLDGQSDEGSRVRDENVEHGGVAQLNRARMAERNQDFSSRPPRATEARKDI